MLNTVELPSNDSLILMVNTGVTVGGAILSSRITIETEVFCGVGRPLSLAVITHYNRVSHTLAGIK